VAKRNIEVVNIDIGVDIEQEIRKAARNISEDTRKAIDIIVSEAQEKQQKKQESFKQKQDVADKTTQCLEKLLLATREKPLHSDEMKSMMNMTNLSGIMTRLKHALKDGQIKKRKLNKAKGTRGKYWYHKCQI